MLQTCTTKNVSPQRWIFRTTSTVTSKYYITNRSFNFKSLKLVSHTNKMNKSPIIEITFKFPEISDNEHIQIFPKSFSIDDNGDVEEMNFVKTKLQSQDKTIWKHDHGELNDLKLQQPFLDIVMSLYEGIFLLNIVF